LDIIAEPPSDFYFQCDISKKNEIDITFDQIISKYGKIDILLNNAATKSNNLVEFFKDDVDYSPETWRAVMDTNLDGAFWVLQKVGQQMIRQKNGVIIHTGSIYAVMAADQRIYEGSYYLEHSISNPAVYAASKSAIVGLTRHFAARWAEHNIRVNCVSPGGVSSGQNTTFSEKYSTRVPLNRMATPVDLVGAIIYLASDASAYVTGQNLLVDGGLSAW
jgi:NAD(P)-dependent dehydrogenase (short-subunit alcohol dehydrogenase family)